GGGGATAALRLEGVPTVGQQQPGHHPDDARSAVADVCDEGAQPATRLAAQGLEETGDIGVGHRPATLDDGAGVMVGEHRHQVAPTTVQGLAGGVEQLERQVDRGRHPAGGHPEVAGQRRHPPQLVG
ncbi:hypothetical protein C7B66_21660, partial [Bacillus halotolerans]